MPLKLAGNGVRCVPATIEHYIAPIVRGANNMPIARGLMHSPATPPLAVHIASLKSHAVAPSPVPVAPRLLSRSHAMRFRTHRRQVQGTRLVHRRQVVKDKR
eukprot:4943644-Prymnesium_polylepis.1